MTSATVQILRDFLTLYAPMLAIGVFLNAVAPLRYKTQIQHFFENPKWQLNAAVAAFVANTFHRVFGQEIFSWRFLISAIIFSISGFIIFTALYYFMNDDSACKYPIDWCSGLQPELIREALLLLLAMIAIDILSFAQTSLLIRYAQRSSRSYELAFIAYADIVLTLSIFCFVLPIFITFNHLISSKEATKTDVFLQIAPREQIPPEPEPKSEVGNEDGKASDTDDDELKDMLKRWEKDPDKDARLVEISKIPGAQLVDLNIFIRDNENRDRLQLAATSAAVLKGSVQEIESIIRILGAKNGIHVTAEPNRQMYSKESIRTLKAHTNLIQPSTLLIYSYVYTSVLSINHAFTWFLRGSPLFTDINRDPLLAMVRDLGESKEKTYLCFCATRATESRAPETFLDQEKYLIFRANAMTELAQAHVIFERKRHLVSLSVFFATSMFVTVIFYFGLLVFLLPAYAYRTALIMLLKKLGSVGKKNAVSIMVALGALPLATILVAASRLF